MDKPIRELANFTLARPLLVEILRCHQHPGNQDGGIDGRELRVPGASTADRIEKMIVKALIAGRVGFRTLMTIGEKAEGNYAPFYSLISREPSPFHTYWECCQSK